MSHHDVLDATHRNCNVILLNHSNSEREYLRKFSNEFNQILNSEQILVDLVHSKLDSDPLNIY